jgi:phage/plasmid primase-like uncharacterized protein
LTLSRTDERVERARAVPIERVLAPHKLRRSGGELVGACPLCGGHDRFGVNIRKNIWNCRGCGQGGDVISLVRHIYGCGFNNALERLTGERAAIRLHEALEDVWLAEKPKRAAEKAASEPKRPAPYLAVQPPQPPKRLGLADLRAAFRARQAAVGGA